MRRYSIALIPGDGIGQEVIPEGVRVLRALADRHGFALDLVEYPYGTDYYLAHGVMIPEEGFEALKEHDAIYLGAVGDPRKAPDHVTLRGLLIPLRQRFDLYVNLRPARALKGVPTPLKGDPPFDFEVVRENAEGEYAGAGGELRGEVAVQTAIFTRRGTERIARFALERARARRGELTVATKSNALQHGLVFWDRVIREVAAGYPEVRLAGAMMLEFLGEAEAARELMAAVEAVTAEGRVRTPDLGGRATTREVTEAALARLGVKA